MSTQVKQGYPNTPWLKCDFCGTEEKHVTVWSNSVTDTYIPSAAGWTKTFTRPANAPKWANYFDVCPACKANGVGQ